MSDQEKIRSLEKRIKDLEYQEKEREGESINVESVVGQLIPGLGGIVKALENSSPEFRKRIAQTDAEIKHRLESGWSQKPEVTHGISMRPLSGRRTYVQKTMEKEPEKEKVETELGEPIIDIFEEKDYISVIAELPGVDEKDIEIKIKDDTLEIYAGKYCKTINLPAHSKSIIERTYKNGILQFKIER
ncbi:MAG: Hsp20/alpha crystallin family protein [Nitrospirae bacterium]|nr:Hsp20/alpha crystallin family protein [Nitrospirota bacterium]